MEGKRLEPPTASYPGPTTYYAYDLLDHLTLVYMALCWSSAAYFRLQPQQQPTNPENGTVTYTYNSFNK